MHFILSQRIINFFDGSNLEKKQHEAFPLITTNEDGLPHAAMISVGEMIVIDEKTLRIALWTGTKTTGNIVRAGKATVIVVLEGVVHYIGLSLTPLLSLPHSKYQLDRFLGNVISYKEDTAKYADVTSGIQIQLKDSESVLSRWRETIEELKY